MLFPLIYSFSFRLSVCIRVSRLDIGIWSRILQIESEAIEGRRLSTNVCIFRRFGLFFRFTCFHRFGLFFRFTFCESRAASTEPCVPS
jgi:hypothetical protein